MFVTNSFSCVAVDAEPLSRRACYSISSIINSNVSLNVFLLSFKLATYMYNQ